MARLIYNKDGRLLFTKEMKKEYTILIPTMLPIHFGLIQNVLDNYGYKTIFVTLFVGVKLIVTSCSLYDEFIDV